MTPARAIAMLDRQLAKHGETVKVAGLTMRGFVRGYQPNELVGTITQKSKKVILSPTGFGQTEVPQTGNVVVAGKPFRIQSGGAIRMNDVIVRVEYQVTG